MSKGKSAPIDLHARDARVVSVFGPFASRVLVEMSATVAAELFPDGALGAAGPSRVIDATEQELQALRERAPELADSALAASAVAMAYEVEHPFNSATSKSMCQARLADAMGTLRDLAPPMREKDDLDDLAARRAERRAKLPARGAGTEGSVRS